MKKSPVQAIRLVFSLTIGFMVWVSLISQSLSAVVYVDPNGSIQAAIDGAAHGDVIILHPGTYHENINSGGQAITIRSTDPNDPAVVAATIINGGETGRVVTFDHGEGSSTILSGLTITNGRASQGAGIHCSLNSSPNISRCVITGNTATWQGGGIYCHDSSPAISQCTISDNTISGDGSANPEAGGGIYGHQSSSAITDCIITGNTSLHGQGGGICCESSSSLSISGCQITGNSGIIGGGICMSSSSPSITNCTISGNRGGTGGGIYCWASSPMITNCTISGNTAGGGCGGISCRASSPMITNCTISGNNDGGIDCWYSSPMIINCTIRGNTTEADGGGINCHDSSPSITSCTISGNTAARSGGGIYCGIYCDLSSASTITNCTISGNTAHDGGGIYGHESSLSVTNCTITGNTAEADGGGIYCDLSSAPTITNCTISGNKAGDGGGIYCYESAFTITNCTISGNTADYYGDGIYCRASPFQFSPKVINSILWGDLKGVVPHEIYQKNDDTITVMYSDIQGGYTGEGNINADPLFVDPNGGDYHLQPNSPCIDTGSPNSTIYKDRDGAIRPFDGNGDGVAVVDMGAYEYHTPQEITFTLHLPEKWSMISLPVKPSDRRVKSLFPGAEAVFGFTTSYVLLDPNAALEAGKGYWIYVPEEKTYSLRGLPIERIEIPEAKGGWSMIGSCTESSTPSVDQGAIRAIFGFSDKYNFLGPGDPLQPGKGYWINLSGGANITVK